MRLGERVSRFSSGREQRSTHPRKVPRATATPRRTLPAGCAPKKNAKARTGKQTNTRNRTGGSARGHRPAAPASTASLRGTRRGRGGGRGRSPARGGDTGHPRPTGEVYRLGGGLGTTQNLHAQNLHLRAPGPRDAKTARGVAGRPGRRGRGRERQQQHSRARARERRETTRTTRRGRDDTTTTKTTEDGGGATRRRGPTNATPRESPEALKACSLRHARRRLTRTPSLGQGLDRRPAARRRAAPVRSAGPPSWQKRQAGLRSVGPP